MVEEDVEGWELYDEYCYEVSNFMEDYKEFITKKTYIKNINGEWYYKEVKNLEKVPYVEFKPYDGKGITKRGFLK